MTTERRLYLAELRAGRITALGALEQALRQAEGSVQGAARQLGVGVSSLYRAAEECSAVRQTLRRSGMGRRGAAACALRARGHG